MDNSVIIKGLNHGIIVVLDSELDYELLKERVIKKFRDSAKFLGSAQIALSFEGRELTKEQQNELLGLISENTELQIVCLFIKDPETEELFRQSLMEQQQEQIQAASRYHNTGGQFYKGNLRSGQNINSETSIVVIGDVNAGAEIRSRGNIVILGSLRGAVFAGEGGNEKAFVLALEMMPVQIGIAGRVARAPDNPSKSDLKTTRIAFLEDENIYIEPVSKKVLNEREL